MAGFIGEKLQQLIDDGGTGGGGGGLPLYRHTIEVYESNNDTFDIFIQLVSTSSETVDTEDKLKAILGTGTTPCICTGMFHYSGAMVKASAILFSPPSDYNIYEETAINSKFVTLFNSNYSVDIYDTVTAIDNASAAVTTLYRHDVLLYESGGDNFEVTLSILSADETSYDTLDKVKNAVGIDKPMMVSGSVMRNGNATPACYVNFGTSGINFWYDIDVEREHSYTDIVVSVTDTVRPLASITVNGSGGIDFSEIGSIDTWAGEPEGLDYTSADGITFDEIAQVFNKEGTSILDVDISHRIPLVAGDGVEFIKNDDNRIQINANDTKNTAGATNVSNKLYIIGATSQTANPQTYSHDTAYVGTDGHLYSNSKQTITQIKVGDTTYSASSGVASLPAYPQSSIPKLYAPTIKISGLTLTIKNPVKNKDYVASYDIYNVDTNTLIRNTKKTTVDLERFNIADGTYNIAVKAKGIEFNGTPLYEESDYSNVLSYTHDNPPTLATSRSWYKGTVDISTITEITFDNTYEVTGNETESWDASSAQNGSVMCYLNGTSITIKPIHTSNKVHAISCSSMFYNFTSLIAVNNLTALDTSNVTSMGSMFRSCNALTTLDVSGFDTSNVTSMGYLFNGCNALTTLDVSGFDTSNVTNMSNMFDGCNALTTLDVSGFDTSNVTIMQGMFNGCNALTTLDVSGFDTSNVTKMNNMFQGCSALTTLDVSGFDTSNVTTMGYMFNGCKTLTSLDVSNFDTSNVTTIFSLFQGCNALTTLDVSNFDTSNVTSISGMFSGCKTLTSLDVSGFDTSNVMTMSNMFDGCNALTTLDVSGFDTSNVTRMTAMFRDCNVLTADCSSWDVDNVTSYSYFNTNAPNVIPPVWVN